MRPDISENKKKQDIIGPNVEDGFVRYDPDNLPYEKLRLCEYLSELPELAPEEVKDPKEN
jgi:hypothetical protein